MEYKTMTRKEIAAVLNMSPSTLYRRIKKLDASFRERIKDKRLLLAEEVKYIHEGIGGSEVEKPKNQFPDFD